MTSSRYVEKSTSLYVANRKSQSMVDLGFTYEGSTAGSSVRFDPPDSKDHVSIH